jgi:hypothetical protein
MVVAGIPDKEIRERLALSPARFANLARRSMSIGHTVDELNHQRDRVRTILTDNVRLAKQSHGRATKIIEEMACLNEVRRSAVAMMKLDGLARPEQRETKVTHTTEVVLHTIQTREEAAQLQVEMVPSMSLLDGPQVVDATPEPPPYPHIEGGDSVPF